MDSGILRNLSSDDVGTRLEHAMDLQNVWSTALGILTGPGYHTELEKLKATRLEIALALLQNYMEMGYNATSYAKEINNLPTPITVRCPRCGCDETETEGDCPAGRWWTVCKRCRLYTDKFDNFTTT